MEFLCCYTRLTLKEVDRIERNRWTESIGMSGQGRAEQVDRVVRNTHPYIRVEPDWFCIAIFVFIS